MKTPSKNDLLAIVRNYYSATHELLYTPETSQETKRLQALWAQRLENMEPWHTFLNELEKELPNLIVGDTLSTSDGGPRCLVYPSKESRSPTGHWVVVGCISLLAPVYMIYGVEFDYAAGGLRQERASFEQPPPSMILPAKIVAGKIEKTFGFSAVPREIAETPVSLFVGGQEPSAAKLFHALFTSDPSVIP